MKKLLLRVCLPLFIIGISVLGCAVSILVPPLSISSVERHEMFKALDPPVHSGSSVSWNEWGVPFIESDNDSDAAFLVGMTHAHLRIGQMELMKRIAYGRISESAGPFTAEIDAALRTLDIPRAVDSIVRSWPEDTLHWVSRYVEGINFLMRETEVRPPEFSRLGFEKERWSIHDIAALSRLYAADVNWIAWASLLSIPEPSIRENVFQLKLLMGDARTSNAMASRIADVSLTGSNAFVLSGSKMKTGKPFLGSDPHVGYSIPNLWILYGLKSPSYHVAGMTLPGMPFVALGRNPDVAWGGTNMRGLSTSFYEVPSDAPLKKRSETIRQRFWFDLVREVRESEWGPILTDLEFFNENHEIVALSWVGHSPSDEISAFLLANKAKNAEQFQQAFSSYAVSAQNFLFATESGDIGYVPAMKLPMYDGKPIAQNILTPHKVRPETLLDLSTQCAYKNPQEGYIVSANQKPVCSPSPGYFFSSPSRSTRLKELLNQEQLFSADELGTMQTDIVSRGSLDLMEMLRAPGFLTSEITRDEVFRALLAWDGGYAQESREALTFEVLFSFLIPDILTDAGIPSRYHSRVTSGPEWKLYAQHVLRTMSVKKRSALFARALTKTSAYLDSQSVRVWGDIHMMRLGFILGRLPLLGTFYVYYTAPTDGTSDTLMKTAHPLTREIHTAQYGSVARQLIDLVDIDNNFFVLLGGQDGWLGAQHAIDQIPLWNKRQYIQIPLSPEGRAVKFHKVVRY